MEARYCPAPDMLNIELATRQSVESEEVLGASSSTSTPTGPRFAERRMTLADGVVAGAAPLSVLLLETLATVLLALWAIQRADTTRE